jgi:hypothetical protein
VKLTFNEVMCSSDVEWLRDLVGEEAYKMHVEKAIIRDVKLTKKRHSKRHEAEY